MAYINIDVDLDDFDTDDLLSELYERSSEIKGNDRLMKEFISICRAINFNHDAIVGDNLDSHYKIEILQDLAKRKTLLELEEIAKNY